MRLKEEVIEWSKTLVLAFFIAVVLNKYVLGSIKVDGHSMEPTYYDKDRLISSIIAMKIKKVPKRFDVVVVESPDFMDENSEFGEKIEEKDRDLYLKRVIGLPGDRVEILNGEVYVNGELIQEDYIDEGVYTETSKENTWEIPEDSVFVLGDNRHTNGSHDSRAFGPVKLDAVHSIVRFRFFPIRKTA